MQAGQHTLTVESLKDEAATQARELAIAQAAAQRSAALLADREAELQELRAAFEARLSGLTCELQSRDEQLEFLRQHLEGAHLLSQQAKLALPMAAAPGKAAGSAPGTGGGVVAGPWQQAAGAQAHHTSTWAASPFSATAASAAASQGGLDQVALRDQVMGQGMKSASYEYAAAGVNAGPGGPMPNASLGDTLFPISSFIASLNANNRKPAVPEGQGGP